MKIIIFTLFFLLTLQQYLSKERYFFIMEIIKLREEYIKLGQALKAAGFVDSGVEAKIVIQDGLVNVNGAVEYQRGKKLVDGDVVEFEGNTIKIEK